MSGVGQFLAIAVTAFGMLVFLCVLGGLLIAAGLGPCLPLLVLVAMVYGWMLCVYLYYRRGRQEEMMHLLGTAADSQAPLAPALWAYLHDRPQGPLREFWVALLLFFVLPGYYWIWHRRNSFDQKVARVAYFLEVGESLPKALQAAPGVVSRDMVLAAQIGQYTGRLSQCLRASLPPPLAPVWIELAPRLLYPMLLLLFLSGIIGFWMNFLWPKLELIFREFDSPMPEATQQLARMADWNHLFGAVPTAIFVLLGVVVVLIVSPMVRWHFPIVGRLYRRHMQSHVLRMLAVLLDTGMPAPQALGVLADSERFPDGVEQRLLGARRRIERGEPLADSLLREGLLSKALVPLVQAAERVNNLPWALSELGELLAGRTIRALRRFSQVAAPAIVIALGFLVAFIVIGMFMPLIDLITRLAEQ